MRWSLCANQKATGVRVPCDVLGCWQSAAKIPTAADSNNAPTRGNPRHYPGRATTTSSPCCSGDPAWEGGRGTPLWQVKRATTKVLSDRGVPGSMSCIGKRMWGQNIKTAAQNMVKQTVLADLVAVQERSSLREQPLCCQQSSLTTHLSHMSICGRGRQADG